LSRTFSGGIGIAPPASAVSISFTLTTIRKVITPFSILSEVGISFRPSTWTSLSGRYSAGKP
jgi:hypothetical protein